MSTVPVSLSPRPGFCVKSTTLGPALIPKHTPSPTKSGPNILEPTEPAANAPIPVPKNTKVFVNIAWDANVPPPPESNERAIQRAIQGQDDLQLDKLDPEAWYVPVIVSNPRTDKDKAGSPSIVIDCIYNTSVKARTLRDSDFKIFLIELALQRIEAQYGLSLSRSIGTPNIASKGQLVPRIVQIPAQMVASTSTGKEKSTPVEELVKVSSGTAKKPLIQEITPSDTPLPGLRGILKPSKPTLSKTEPEIRDTSSPLEWSWTKEEASGKLKVQVNVPNLTTALIRGSTLDVEPRRIILEIPPYPTLDINVSVSDAEIAAKTGQAYAPSKSEGNQRQEATSRTLLLKRQRQFDVDSADAQWKVGSGIVEIFV